MKRVIKASGGEKLRNIIDKVERYSTMPGYTTKRAIETVADELSLSDKVIDYLYRLFEISR